MATVRAEARAAALGPYVPRLVVDWLRDHPEVVHRRIEGTLAFADVSGFTRLTERLGRRGKAGAEEMADLINATFEPLLSAAYDYGAGLLKWGGDAVLLLFDGPDHAARGCRAVTEMQRVMRRIGRVTTSSGQITLRISVGVHAGAFDAFLVGDRHRELVIVGDNATTLVRAEAAAAAGTVLLTPAVATQVASLRSASLRSSADWFELVRPPDVPQRPNRVPKPSDEVDLGRALSSILVDHVTSGVLDPEHRQVSVAFVSIDGVDAFLAEHGPDACAAALEEVVSGVQAAAEDHGVAFLATDLGAGGPKVMLAAGAPRHRGDDEARMLGTLCALSERSFPLSVRSGATSGRVFAGDFGPFYRRTYSVAGDCVNLAARLMGAAPPGEVLVSEAVIERSRTAFDHVATAPLVLKGKSEPVQAYAVRSAATSAVAASSDALPLVGRDRELSVLEEAHRHVVGGSGTVVVVSGDAGIGKSRLVREFADRIGERPLWVNGDIHATSTPYLHLRRLFGDRLGAPATAGSTATASLLTATVTATAPHLLPWLPLIGIVAGVEVPTTAEVEALGEAARRTRLEEVTSEFLGTVLNRPTIIVFDDVHLLDDATTGLLRRLAQDIAHRPWLLLVARRPDTVLGSGDLPGARSLDVGPLDDGAVEELVDAVTDTRPIPPRARAVVARRAGGNPLFVFELAAIVHQDAALDSLPSSIEGVIASRIDRLAPVERRWLRTASVIGMTANASLLSAVMEQRDADSVDVGRLADFVTVAAEGGVTFRHHLEQHVAYEGLSYRRRSILHARVGDVIEGSSAHPEREAALLSHHFLAAERFHAAWRYSRIAADDARSAYAHADAVDLYERALSAAAHLNEIDANELSVVHEALADALYEVGEFERSAGALRAARRTAAGAIRLAQLHLKTALVAERSGEWDRAVGWIRRGRHLLNGQLDDITAQRVAARLDVRRARMLYHLGRTAAAGRWARQAVADAERCGERESLARALLLVDWIDAIEGRLDSEPRAPEALAIFTEIGDLIGEALTRNSLGSRAFYRGEWAAAVDHYRASETAYLRAGTSWDAALSACNLAEILVCQRRYAEARERLTGALRVLRAAGGRPEIAFCNTLLARVDLGSGRLDEASRLLEEERRYYEARDQRVELADVQEAIAAVVLRRGHPAEGLAVADRALAALGHDRGAFPAVPALHRVRGCCLAALGRWEEAGRAFTDSLSAARARGAMHDVAFTLDAALEHAATAGSVGSGAAEERDRLFAGLGILPGSALPA